MRKLALTVVFAALLVAPGAASAQRRTEIGIGSGAVAGAVVGGPVGAVIGAAAGGLIAATTEPRRKGTRRAARRREPAPGAYRW